MKRKIAIILVVVFAVILFTGTVAYAEEKTKADKVHEKVQEKLEALKEMEPILAEISANRTEVRALSQELRAQHKACKAYISGLRENPDEITEEQIQEFKDILAEIRGHREELKSTNPQMVSERQNFRTARKNRDYDSMKTALQNIVGLQEERIVKLNGLIDLYKQIIN